MIHRRVTLFRSVLITASVGALLLFGYIFKDRATRGIECTGVKCGFEKASNSTDDDFAEVESEGNNASEVDALNKSEIPSETKSEEDGVYDELIDPEYSYENHTSSPGIDVLKKKNNSKEANDDDIDGNKDKEVITVDTVIDDENDEYDYVNEDDDEYDDHMKTNESTAASSNWSVTLEGGKMYELVGDQLYHDSTHFTQGLTYSRSTDILYESVGLYSKSQVCKLNATTGHTILCKAMASQYFAEGMQLYSDGGHEKLIQITWKKKTGFIYDAISLDLIQEFQFSTTEDEGWGICFDESNDEFIVSDGSPFLHFWDIKSLKEKRKIKVTRQSGSPAYELNELEFMNGKILANVWYEDVLLVIDPHTGKCEMEYDFSSLWPERKRGGNVLNGISISNEDGVVYVTGKLWDRMFKVKLSHFKGNGSP